MSMLTTLKTLSELPGVSGYEHQVRDAIIKEIEGHCQYEVDALGNIIAFKKGTKKTKNTILFSAHMDEVGFIVTHIEDSGLLRFQPVGGIDTRVAFGRAVEVGQNRLPGVIGGKAVHLTKPEEREKPVEFEDMTIDIGALSKEEAEKHVSLGDRAMFYAPYEAFGKDKIVGKAFDDRAGCVMLIDMIQSELEYDCTFSFTVMEENGCIGGMAAAYRVNPDYAIAIETTTAADISGVEPANQVCRQGEGAAVLYGDRGTIYHAELFQLALDTAKKHDIPCQVKEGLYGGNEGRVLQTAREGARTLTISLPCRYLHSATCMLDTRDIESMRRLLEVFTAEMANR